MAISGRRDRSWDADGGRHRASYYRALAATAEFPLTRREKRLLRRLAQGLSDAAIARAIGGTVDQVQDQRTRLLSKLQITSPGEIIEAAQRLAPWGPRRSAAA